MGRPCNSNIAIESNQSISQVPVCDFVILKNLIHYARLRFMEEKENKFDEVSCHVGIRRDLFLRKEKACEVEQLMNMTIPDKVQIILLKLKIRKVKFVNIFQKVLR